MNDRLLDTPMAPGSRMVDRRFVPAGFTVLIAGAASAQRSRATELGITSADQVAKGGSVPLENEDHRRIWEAWHRASIDRDQEALLALYSEDAVLEAPLIPKVMQQESGVVHGRDGIRAFLDEARKSGAASSGPRVPMHWWREPHFFSAGNTLIWEYPRETPEGDQMDIVEVMAIANGLIAHHKVYWGWKLATPFKGASSGE